MSPDSSLPVRPGLRRAQALRAQWGVALILLVAHPFPVAAAGSPARQASSRPASAASPARSAPSPGGADFLSPGSAAMRIARDPETGGWTLAPLGLQPGLEDAPSMALNQSDAGLVQERLESGGYAIRLQGRLQCYSVASRGLDGALTTGCVDDVWNLAWWLSGRLPLPAPASPAAPEK